MCLSFQDARLEEICCFTSVNVSDGRRDKSGAAMFWPNGWFLLLSCIFFYPVINLTSSGWLFLISGKKNAVYSFCWVETSILTAQFPRIHFSLILLKLLQWLGGDCPLSMTHSLQDTQPRQICLSWVFWAGCWSGDCSKAPGRRKRGASFLGKLRLYAGWKKDTGCPNGMGLSQREKQSAAKRRCDQPVKEQ